VVVAAAFVTCLITAHVTAVKLIGVLGGDLPAGVMMFPVSYIVGDVLIEVYGDTRSNPLLTNFCGMANDLR
jgi:uncharacterized PurR-regulated membrane protein YhhQ (DUF165 family)